MAAPKKKSYPYGPASAKPEEKTKAQLAEKEEDKALLGNNYLLVGIAGLMIILGFALISGSSTGLDEYNPDIYSTRRIVVGPTISFLGFVLMAVAIVVKPKQLRSLFRGGKSKQDDEKQS